ncbi:MAG: hypothetical protein IJ570_02605 [Prevotella sp.]|nr:hypothetical protein [Prevotella sp.]
MKKFFTLITALFALTATGWAQEEEEELDDAFVFTDLEGNVVPDGSVITVNTLNEEGQMKVPLLVKNVSGERAAGTLYETIDDKPNGEWQTCAFGNCMILAETGYSPKSVQDADAVVDILTEWIPEENQYASWSATLQIHHYNISKNFFGQESVGTILVGYGPKVTIKFDYADPANISNIKAGQAEVARYSLCGRRLTAPQKGINIVRLANGKAVKKIVK